MRIALDIDGTLADFNNGYADLLEQLGAPAIDRTPPWPLAWDWPEEAAPDHHIEAWALIQADPEFYIRLAPAPDALRLASTGELMELFIQHEVYLVTNRPHRARGATEFWIGELLGEYVGSIHVEGPKGPVCLGIGADLLIDDKPEHIQSAELVGLIGRLVASPSNEGTESLTDIVGSLLTTLSSAVIEGRDDDDPTGI